MLHSMQALPTLPGRKLKLGQGWAQTDGAGSSTALLHQQPHDCCHGPFLTGANSAAKVASGEPCFTSHSCHASPLSFDTSLIEVDSGAPA